MCCTEADGKEKDGASGEDKEEKSESKKKKKGSGAHQGVAVLGIALIAMGEEIGVDMALRAYAHLVSDFGASFLPCAPQHLAPYV